MLELLNTNVKKSFINMAHTFKKVEEKMMMRDIEDMWGKNELP